MGDRALTAAIELDVMKKSLESQKKANRKFRQQKEVEIRQYRKRICVLEEEQESLLNQMQGQSVVSEDFIKPEATVTEIKTSTARPCESDMEIVAGTSSSEADTGSIVHINNDEYGVL